MSMGLTAPRYTVDDLEHFPHDGNRYELLDGVLLVTPGPGPMHQIIASRLSFILGNAVQVTGLGYVVGPGTVTRPPLTHLEPDILVFPSHFPINSKWFEISTNWLAVEILSRSSHFYDRNFKVDAYFALGVREVWLVDPRAKSIEVWRAKGVSEVHTRTLTWRVWDAGIRVDIDTLELFAGVE